MFRLLVLAVALATTSAQIDSRTIFQYIQEKNLTTLVSFLVGTGLDKTLNNPDSSAMTLFAPTEKAFKKLPPNFSFALTFNSTALKNVLQGHVVDQLIFTDYVRDHDVKVNLNGDPLVFRVYDNGARTINGVILKGNDISVKNGIVHLIDDVILPTESNLGEYIAQHDADFKDLFGLLVLGRLFGALETAGPFTLFAPTDAAFDAVTSTVQSLITNRSALSDILQYHVVSDSYWSVGLEDGMVLATLNGGNITININQDGATVNGAKVLTADIPTSNGVIHVIDKVLVPGS